MKPFSPFFSRSSLHALRAFSRRNFWISEYALTNTGENTKSPPAFAGKATAASLRKTRHIPEMNARLSFKLKKEEGCLKTTFPVNYITKIIGASLPGSLHRSLDIGKDTAAMLANDDTLVIADIGLALRGHDVEASAACTPRYLDYRQTVQ